MLQRSSSLRIGAVVVGVNNGLRLAENDALDHWTLLSSGAGPFRTDGAEPLLGLQATVEAVDAALRRLARQRVDIVIFVFAGHANEGGILLAGSRLYPYRTLLERLRESGAARQLVILDACKAGAFAELAGRTKVGGFRGVEPLTDPHWLAGVRRWPPGLRVVASARSDEFAHESKSPTERNSFFTASYLEHARTLPADLPSGAVSDLAIVARVTHDLGRYHLPQTPLVWGRPAPIPIVQSEHDRGLGRAVISSVQPFGAELVVSVGTVDRRFLPTHVHMSAVSHLTHGSVECVHTFVPLASLALEPIRISAASLMLDDWHSGLALQGYAVEWMVSVSDSWGRVLGTWNDSIRYQAA